MQWQLMNIGLPVLLVLLFGIVYQAVRKRKYQGAGKRETGNGKPEKGSLILKGCKQKAKS